MRLMLKTQIVTMITKFPNQILPFCIIIYTKMPILKVYNDIAQI